MVRSPYQSDLVDIAGILIGVRDKAVWLNAGDRKAWLPRSQIEIDPEDASEGHNVIIAMPEWLAKEKELI